MAGLLSMEALKFLKSCDYQEKNHEERMALIKTAKGLYPEEEEEEDEEGD